MADIFISYTTADRDWALWIEKELRALGHTARMDVLEIGPGDDIYAWMEKRVGGADHVLCVLSDESLVKPFTTLERNAALWKAAKERAHFVLLVVVKPCKVPTLSDHLRRCDLFGMPEDAARLRFREFMEKREQSTNAAFPGKVFAVSNVPIRVPTHFVGRDDALADIHAALRRHEGRVAITALHGLRGVGKTTLAAAYADRHRNDYRATWWIRAQTNPSMRADLVGLAVRLGWVTADDKEEPALHAVMERLPYEGAGILLIFDNAKDAASLNPYLPRGGEARVLITSNAYDWLGIADPIELPTWPKETGADFLIARTGRAAERIAAEALSETLGGLPLAHAQAGAYCGRLNVPIAEYTKRFQDAPAIIMDDVRHAPAEFHDGLTVAKAFAVAIEEAAKLHPAAEPLIVHAALLAPEPIPRFLFSDARERLGEPLAGALAGDGLDEAIAALRTFALLDVETIADERDSGVITDCIRLHRLVRQVAAARCGEAARDEVRRALIEATAGVYPPNIFDDPQTWPCARRLDALVLALVGHEAVPTGCEETAASLLNGAAAYRHVALGAYAEARPLLERALAIRETVLGPEHPDTAQSLNNLAFLLSAQGDLVAARPRLERAVAIREKVLGPQDPQLAVSLINLAHVVQGQGDLAAARPLFERALAINERVLGPQHANTAVSLHGLAVLLQAQGDLAAARPLFERALAIYEKVRGPNHPDTATSLDTLAGLLRAEGELMAARTLFDRALAIRQNVFGPDHPKTGASLNNVASVLHAEGNFVAARPLLERALATCEKVLGPDHPHTAASLNNLAGILQELGDLAAARPLLERALAIREKVSGPNHPETAVCLNNLALLLQIQGDLAAARPLFERALAIRENAFGPNHSDTATSLSNLGRSLGALGQNDAAEPLFRRAIAIGEKVLGPGHPLTQRYQSHYARLLLMTDRPTEALRVGEIALAIHTRAHGPSHPRTKDSARVTADALDALGRSDEAKELRSRYGIEGKAS